MYFATKRAFSMIELIIVVFVISIGVLSIVYGLNKGFDFVQKSRQKVIGINLAREGVEAVFNIRDTNWNNAGNNRDKCWLKTDPFDLEGDHFCYNDVWMQSGSYILSKKDNLGQQYFALDVANLGELNLLDGISDIDLQFSLCQIKGIWSSCSMNQPISHEGSFFREIKGKGLFLKNSLSLGGQYVNCVNGDDMSGLCGDSSAKEYRFCVNINYVAGNNLSETSLCALITNFW